MQAWLEIFPWDLADEGVDQVLDVLHGQVGATGLSLPIATPPVRQVRRRDVEPRCFQTGGGVAFRSADEHYEATRLRPIAADWVHARQLTREIAEGCAERGIAIRAVVMAGCFARIARKHPDAAMKNALGGIDLDRLCFANADVQQMIAGLVAETVSRLTPESIELANFADAPDTSATGLSGPVPPLVASYLRLCVCESCRQKADDAGIDHESAVRAVRVSLARYLDGDDRTAQALNSLHAEDGPLMDYLDWRAAECRKLLDRIRSAAGGPVVIRQDRRSGRPDRFRGFDPTSRDRVSAVVRETADVVHARGGDGGAREIHLPAETVLTPDQELVVRLCSEAAEAGADAISVSGYGWLPASALTPVKQGFRFARRISGA